MSTYLLSVCPDESQPKTVITHQLELSDDDLIAVAIMLSAGLGLSRDDRAEIQTIEGTRLDLSELLEDCDNIVFEGEAAEHLEPGDETDWLEQIDAVAEEFDESADIIMKYTLKIDSEQPYLIQFNSRTFLSGLYGVCQWFGIDPEACLIHFHEGDHPMDLPTMKTSVQPEIELIVQPSGSA